MTSEFAELSDAGFLMRFKGSYALGPRCIQLG